MFALDFGAGCGAALSHGHCGHRRRLITLRGKVAKVVACDLGEVTLSDAAADETGL